MSDVSSLSGSSLNRLLSSAVSPGSPGAGGAPDSQPAERAEQRTQAALSVGSESNAPPTGGRGRFVDVYA